MSALGADAAVPAGTLMQGKRGLVMGVANNRSIAWGIAKAVADAGRRAGLHLSGRRAQEAGRAAGGGDRLEARAALRRDRRRASMDAVFAELGAAMGHARFPGPCHRLLRQGPARRALRRHHREQLHPDAC